MGDYKDKCIEGSLAKKNNEGKPPWHLLLKDFKHPLESVIRVREHGAKKYGEDNFKNEKPEEDFFTDPAIRHIVSHMNGELLDPESGEPHLAHAITTLLIEMYHTET